MTQPLVLCVMPAAGRQSMVNRAVCCFRAQTYSNKLLAILDNGPEPLVIEAGRGVHVTRLQPGVDRRPIGELRNLVNALALPGVFDAPIIAHWDSDDVSSAERLTEQVALLQQSGAEAVGYGEMLFWDSRPGAFCGAWLFTSPNPRYCLGTSLCYWRKTWERRPFENRDQAEDTIFVSRVKATAVSSVCGLVNWENGPSYDDFEAPRMVASIHGQNTASKIEPGRAEWQRTPGWDNYCREVMNAVV